MHDTFVVDPQHLAGGFIQSMTINGVPKGLKLVLTERGLWPTVQNPGSRFLTQCSIKSSKGKSEPNPICLEGGNCCARALLAL